MTTLPPALLEPLVRTALAEDLGGAGDLTTTAIIPAGHRSTFRVVARQAGVVSGVESARLAWQLLDAEVRVDVARGEGARVEPGDVVAEVAGPTRALLTGERVALNLLGHLSGVATATAGLVAAVAHTNTRIACTRKTTPGLRALEKAAVRAGGGVNHRFGLYDAVLIKDNHVAVAGSLPEAIRRARANVGHLVSIEFEVDTLAQLAAVLAEPDLVAACRVVLLDNMGPDVLREAVAMVDGRLVTEASGRVTAQTAPGIAAAGVDLISAGWITHSAPVLDLGLDA
ncbi:MAG: carboxylating nicotinate-nucleotide diphosphorylase [Actinomycetales bacterium]|nr:carboxylating nicotinate-nucleotide diphosphorylase [Actinomycetales bacterium]